MKGNGWFTGDDRDMNTSETERYEIPKEPCIFTGVFVGRRGLPVPPNHWHSMECCFKADDGRRIKLFAHRYYAWNTDFPIDFAENVIVGSRWRCEVRITENGTIAWHRAEPISTASQLKKYRENQLYGPHEI